MHKDRSGANNPMYGKAKGAETLAKLRKFIYVYDIQDNNRLIGVYPTVECKNTFSMGHTTLINALNGNGVYKGRLFRREPLSNST